MILTLRTDNPEAEVGVYSNDGKQLSYKTWQAHRELEATIFQKIDEVLAKANIEKTSLTGFVVYAGPGSFTGLRIGFAVINALAFGLNVGNVKIAGSDWQLDGIKMLQTYNAPQVLVPDYGGEANITKPRK